MMIRSRNFFLPILNFVKMNSKDSSRTLTQICHQVSNNTSIVFDSVVKRWKKGLFSVKSESISPPPAQIDYTNYIPMKFSVSLIRFQWMIVGSWIILTLFFLSAMTISPTIIRVTWNSSMLLKKPIMFDIKVKLLVIHWMETLLIQKRKQRKTFLVDIWKEKKADMWQLL